MLLKELCDYNASLLQANNFKDYCPNGLQIEGRPLIQKIATAVSASQVVIDAAIAWGADALLVHHGFFWRNENPVIAGFKKQRIAKLLAHDVSLLAYHLPLDAHISLGNNAQLAQKLGIKPYIELDKARLGETGLVWVGEFLESQNLRELSWRVSQVLGRVPQVIGDESKQIKTVAWCTGGAQGYFEHAVNHGVDLYITGEISEPQYHLAQESGVAFMAAGHHATERYGIMALGENLADEFDLEHKFFDQDNPV